MFSEGIAGNELQLSYPTKRRNPAVAGRCQHISNIEPRQKVVLLTAVRHVRESGCRPDTFGRNVNPSRMRKRVEKWG